MGHEQKYRVFISYSHQDRKFVSKIEEILKENGFWPMWDRDFRYGTGFHDQIKNFIAHAHVFLPVITTTADRRKWVHQEIGYAMASNIPVLPVAVGKLPGEMLQQIHAVQLENHDDLELLKNHLKPEAIANLVREKSDPTFALFQCADLQEDRAILLEKYCRGVEGLGVHALFRQKGALSSLHIPNKDITHRVWKDRYGGAARDQYHCRLQRAERLAAEAHARTAGCRLIINPNIAYEKWGKDARVIRLGCLLEFLESMPDSKCQVAFNPYMDHEQSLTILGDWFLAESVSARIGEGYRQTVFTRHAPSMMGRIEAFDQEFKEHLDALGWAAETSRTNAIEIIKGIISDLKKG